MSQLIFADPFYHWRKLKTRGDVVPEVSAANNRHKKQKRQSTCSVGVKRRREKKVSGATLTQNHRLITNARGVEDESDFSRVCERAAQIYISRLGIDCRCWGNGFAIDSWCLWTILFIRNSASAYIFPKNIQFIKKLDYGKKFKIFYFE